MRIEIPDQRKRVHGCAISCIRRLKQNEYRHCVDRILKSSAQKTRPMRRGDYPAIPKTPRPHAGVLRNPIRSMPARSPDFNFVSICLRPILRARKRSGHGEKQSKQSQNQTKRLHKCASPKIGKTIPEPAKILKREWLSQKTFIRPRFSWQGGEEQLLPQEFLLRPCAFQSPNARVADTQAQSAGRSVARMQCS